MEDYTLYMDNRGKLIILSGPSGVGKGTVRKVLMGLPGVNFYFSVSLTTRSKRPGEIEGRDYFYVTREQFEENIAKDNLLEYAEFVGNYYGTPRDKVEAMRDKGRDVLLEIEVNGTQKVIAKCPDAITIFLVPPSFETLEARIRGRSTEDEETIQRRLNKAKAELALQDQYAHVVVNDDVERAAKEILSIIQNA